MESDTEGGGNGGSGAAGGAAPSLEPYAVVRDDVLEALERSARVEADLKPHRSKKARESGARSKLLTPEKPQVRLISRAASGDKPAVSLVREVGPTEPPEELEGYENPESASDDDEAADVNRIGNVPLWWYDKFKHVGYDVSGSRIFRTLSKSGTINALLDPDAWKKVQDPRNQREFALTEADLEIIRRLKSGKYPDAKFDPYGPDSTVEFENRDAALYAKWDTGPHKAAFSNKARLREIAKVKRLAQLIREGRYQLNLPQREELTDIWGPAIYSRDFASRASLFTAPKLRPPGHAASYNPPEEYLFSPDEKREWLERERDDRELEFMPAKYPCLRRVPFYAGNLYERFQRCLDLYLCPRTVKMRWNLKPESLLPVLPDPRDLRPYPTTLSLEYRSTAELSAITGMSFDSSGAYLAVGRLNGLLEIFDVLTTKRLVARRFPASAEGEQAIGAMAFNPVLPILAVSVGTATHVVVLKLPGTSRAYDQAIAARAAASAGGSAAGNAREEIPSTFDVARAMRLVGDGLEEVADSPHVKWGRYYAGGAGGAGEAAGQGPAEGAETPAGSGGGDAGSTEGAEASASGDAAAAGSAVAREEGLGSILAGWTVQETQTVTSLAWHPRGSYFCTVCGRAPNPSLQLAVHSLAKRRSVRPFRKVVGGRARAARFHPSKPWLFVAFQNSLRLYNLAQSPAQPAAAQPAAQPAAAATSGEGAAAVGVAAGGAGAAAAAAGPTRTGAVVKKFSRLDGIADLAVHRSGEHFIAATADKRVAWYDLELGSKPFRVLQYHEAALKVVGFHPRYHLMFSAAGDGCINIFYTRVYDDLVSAPAIVPVKRIQTRAALEPSSRGAGVLTGVWHPFRPWLACGTRSGKVGIFA